MFGCIGLLVKVLKISIEIMVEATAVNTIEFIHLESLDCTSGDGSLMGMVPGLTANFGPFYSKDFSSGVSSFLERLITHLSLILDKVEEVTAVLKVLVVSEVAVEDLEKRCLSFLIWVFLYCRNVFSLLLKIMLCRFVTVSSSSFCCRDVLVLAI